MVQGRHGHLAGNCSRGLGNEDALARGEGGGKGATGRERERGGLAGLEGLGETRALWDPGPRPECSRRVFPTEFQTLLDFILGCGEPCEVREQGRGGF